MSYFAVIREAGPAWAEGKGAFEQPGVEEHGAFMNALAADGFVLFGGPLAGTESARIRVLLLVEATNESEIEARLRNDPWAVAKRVVTVSTEPWKVFVGAERLPPVLSRL
jgi:uncharacterized protein YciI